MFIKEATPEIIKNSRGEATLQLTLHTYKGTVSCSAPGGKSTGKHEIRAYHEKGINASLLMLKRLCKFLQGKNFHLKTINDLHQIDLLTTALEKRYDKIGANAYYVIHGAFLKAAAQDNNKELWEFIHNDLNYGKKPTMPMPVANIIGGGLHSEEPWGEKPDFQEFHVIPNEKTMSRAVTKSVNAYHEAQTLLHSKRTNDEHATRTKKTNEEVLDILKQIADKYNLRIGLDIAASSFYTNTYYEYKNKSLTRDRVDQIDYIARLIKKYNLFSVEDPMHEEDFVGYREIKNKVAKKTLIVGDDLTTTNPKRLSRALRGQVINAIIIKPNQIGSLLEVKRVVNMCKEHNITMIFSHRSGETMDDILADYAVGFGAQFIKTGIAGKERLIKLKRVMDIEKSLRL